jgi:peptidoglycan pentaglycine glycine transferase (the first glycine)
MYRSRIIGPEEIDSFNNYVAWAPKGHILQSYEWGEIKGRGEWQPLRLLLEDEEYKPQGAITILKRSIPRLGRTIFYAPRDPVGDFHNPAMLDALFEAVRLLAKQHKAVFLKIDPDVSAEDKPFREYLETRGFISTQKGEGFDGVQPKYVFRLDISADEDTLFAQFHQKTRYNIRLAQKKGVTIAEECLKDDLPVFYELLKETTERDKFIVRPYAYFSDIWDYLTPPRAPD